jgi:hypothetical protein
MQTTNRFLSIKFKNVIMYADIVLLVVSATEGSIEDKFYRA